MLNSVRDFTLNMSVWRYVQHGQACGPVETAELQGLIQRGAVSPETLVWRDGLPNWVAASSLPEFAAITPPPANPLPGPFPGGSPGAAPPAAPTDVDQNRAVAILAYFPLLFLVPLMAAPTSRFAKYHANQGLILFLAQMIGWAVFVAGNFTPLGCILWLLMPALVVGGLVFTILGIVNAAAGQEKPLPLIGHFRLVGE